MRHTLVVMLLMGLFAGTVSLLTGCAGSGGTYVETTRDNKPHVFRNRIHNPADYRYVSDASR